MIEYVHFVPGRVRLKISQLKHRRRAVEAEAYVSAIPGVKGAVVNRVTGSITINFDRDRLPISDLWERLRTQGYVSDPCPEPTIGTVSTDNPGAVQIGRTLVNVFVEAVVQRSAQALVRALL